MMYRLAARESSNGNFLLKFRVIFVAITEFVFYLSNSVFFRIFLDYSAESLAVHWLVSQRSLFQSHFLWRPCDFMRKKEFSCFNFFRFFHHLFSLCLLIIFVVSRTASERLLLKFHCTWRQPFNFQSWNISSCKWSRRPLLQYNWFFNL